jgi:hypothetical protein
MLIIYVAILYQAVIPWVLGCIGQVVGYSAFIVNAVKLGFAIVGIVLVVKLVMVLRPLITKATDKITDRTLEMTQSVDSRQCPSCNARVELTMKFCPSCGKTI